VSKPVKRDKNGRLMKGSAPLNPTGNVEVRKRHQHYLQLMEEAISDEDVIAICRTAIEDAKAGNRFARRFIFQYLVGKPATVRSGTPRNAPILALFKTWITNEAKGGADAALMEVIEGEGD
jgi:hypothetical protein